MMFEEDLDPVLECFDSYDAYLDQHVTNADLYYLVKPALARQLVEFGAARNEELITREEFNERKAAADEQRRHRLLQLAPQLASEGKDVSRSPLLQALAEAEDAVRSGKCSVIVFTRDRNAQGQEISGYIDIGHRLKQEGIMEAVFEGRKRLLPTPADLSYYNWNTHKCTENSTDNFEVLADITGGLRFKSKRDRKAIPADPHAHLEDGTTRNDVDTSEYLQAVIYKHLSRRWA